MRAQFIRFAYAPLITCLFLFGMRAEAAPSVSVSPLVIDEHAAARDILKRTITLTNTGTQPVTVFPTVNNISLDEGGGIEDFLPPVMSDRTASLASWLEISRRGIDLKMGESYNTELTIRINPNPQPGVYHAFVGFGWGGNQDEAVKQVERGQAPGVVVTVTIDDNRRIVLKLARFAIDRFITTADNQAAVYTVTNPGDETIVPSGEIIFYDTTGEEVGAVDVNPDKLSIKPGEEHIFTTTVPTNGLFGKYKGFLTVDYGTKQIASIQDTVFFYILPIQKLLIIFGILALIVIVGSWFFHKRYFETDEESDSEYLSFHVRDEHTRAAQSHDIDLKNKK